MWARSKYSPNEKVWWVSSQPKSKWPRSEDLRTVIMDMPRRLPEQVRPADGRVSNHARKGPTVVGAPSTPASGGAFPSRCDWQIDGDPGIAAALRRTVERAMPLRAWKSALRRMGPARVHGKPPPFAYVHRPQALRPGNRIVHLHGGEETFPAMLAAIAGARHYVHLETYILRADRIGTRFQQALIERARARVAVRLIYDSVGSFGLPAKYVQELTAAGV